MSPCNVFLFNVVLLFKDAHIAFELLIKASHARLLESDEIVDVDEMIAKSHLVLLLSLVEVTVEHLQDGIFGINFSVVVLLVDLNLLLQGLRL